MANYILSKEVPWKDILHILRWYIQITYKHCERGIERKMDEPDYACAILESDCRYLQNGLDCYGALRAFLGRQSGTTVLEKEARSVLEETRRFLTKNK